MTSLHGGPADGVMLMLHRAPTYLRVVRSREGDWDALDQLDDVPQADEQIAVYALEGEAGGMHVRARGGCEWYTTAEYRAVDPQPEDATVRDTDAWRAFTYILSGRAEGDTE